MKIGGEADAGPGTGTGAGTGTGTGEGTGTGAGTGAAGGAGPGVGTGIGLGAGPGSKFVAIEVSLELIRALRDPVATLKTLDRGLADQIVRAASSIPANLAEGRKRDGKDRQQFFRTANGSAGEIELHLRTAEAWGYLDAATVIPGLKVLDRLLGLLWGLTHPH